MGRHLRPRGEEHDISDTNPGAILGYVADELAKRQIAFIFVREFEADDSLLGEIKRRFGCPVIANELMSKEDGERFIETGFADALAFGRAYISTPDLAERQQRALVPTTPNENTFYSVFLIFLRKGSAFVNRPQACTILGEGDAILYDTNRPYKHGFPHI